MPSQLPDIPKWAARQIEEGLIKDKLIVQESDKTRELSSVEIRNTLMFIKLDALRGFFQNIAEAKNERSHTAYDISLYQTALIQI